MNRSISYLASNYSKGKNLVAGDVLSVNLSQKKSNQVKVIRPDGSEDLINISFEKDKYLNYSNSNLVGIYKFYSNRILLDVKRVNYNSLESNLDSFPIKEFSQKFKSESNPLPNAFFIFHPP